MDETRSFGSHFVRDLEPDAHERWRNSHCLHGERAGEACGADLGTAPYTISNKRRWVVLRPDCGHSALRSREWMSSLAALAGPRSRSGRRQVPDGHKGQLAKAAAVNEIMTRGDLQWARHFIKTQVWRFAKTMPQWPHWYIVAGEGNRSIHFNRFASLIDKYGEEDHWGRQTRYYLRIGSYKYWVMGEIINRAEPIPSSEVRRLGEQWLRRHGKKVGPYGHLIPAGKQGETMESGKGLASRKRNGKFAPSQYKEAFAAIGTLPKSYLAMLRFHYRHRGRTVTAPQMAHAVGFKRFGGANLHYARIGRLVGERLGWPFEMPLEVLVEFDKRDGHWNWIMRPEVARALELLRWV